jgi:hypothetical protein
MQMNYEHLPDLSDPDRANDLSRRVKKALPVHGDICAVKAKGQSAAVFFRCDESLSDGAVRRIIALLRPNLKELYHFTTGRKMVAYFPLTVNGQTA